jgi:hypothetical protein
VAFLGIAFAEASARLPRFGTPALAVLVTFLAAENLLNTNEYLAELATRGGAGGWTDAIYHLAGSVEKAPGANWYGLVDWGYLNALRMFHEGDLPMFVVADGNAAELKREIETPDCVFIQHAEDKQIFAGVNDRLRQFAGKLGYGEHIERVIHDRNGRPVFELFRFVRGAGSRPDETKVGQAVSPVLKALAKRSVAVFFQDAKLPASLGKKRGENTRSVGPGLRPCRRASARRGASLLPGVFGGAGK